MNITSGLFSRMVLQRCCEGGHPLSGVCEGPGPVAARVVLGSRVVFAGEVGKAAAGRFSATLPVLAPGGPYELTLEIPGGGSVVVADVLVGDVWLLGGQSNMQGCGALVDAAKPHPDVRAFFMDDRWAVAKDPIHNVWTAVDPVHARLTGGAPFDPRRRIGTGPAVAFGKEMLRRTGVPQGLIACAHGGTSMAQWDPALKREGGGSLYGAMVRRLRCNGGRAAGLLWYQGESDCNPDAVARYTDRMVALVRALRRDARDGALPVAMVQIGRTLCSLPDYQARWDAIQDQQRRLPDRITRLAVVPSVDLALDDGIHISGAGQNVLGLRLAEAMEGLRHPGTAAPRLESITVHKHPFHALMNVLVDFSGVAGNLVSGSRPVGFSLLDPAGQEQIYDIRLSGQSVELFTNASLFQADDLNLSHGRGTNPVCNIHDESGRPLPVFGPMPIAPKRVLTPFVRHWKVVATDKEVRLLSAGDCAALPWEEIRFEEDFASLRERLAGQKRGSMMYRVELVCSEPMRLAVLVGYDGPVRVWFDGRRIFDDLRGTNPAQRDEGRSRSFRAGRGRHTVLVALGANDGRAWGIFLRFERIGGGLAKTKQTVALPEVAETVSDARNTRRDACDSRP